MLWIYLESMTLKQAFTEEKSNFERKRFGKNQILK